MFLVGVVLAVVGGVGHEARAEVNTSRPWVNCSANHKAYLMSKEDEALIKVEAVLQQVESRIPTLAENSSIRTALESSRETLQCIRDSIGVMGYDCDNQSDRCTRTNPAAAWVNWIFAEQMNLCGTFWQANQWSDHTAFIVHETSHKCGTLDTAYFRNGRKPESTFWASWQNIADTYYYWVQNGFCVPGMDC